ncbi:hypothetical protein O3G_MSEX013720 [Manduca sexta]|uniref:Uncharacterized protein n=1 Tax=Manduca sexta TaxID=7130 RepID=A0A922CYW2_MANSE|nr:hypothetical protein O3G_MSEX013720 [Manduca sexta]
MYLYNVKNLYIADVGDLSHTDIESGSILSYNRLAITNDRILTKKCGMHYLRIFVIKLIIAYLHNKFYRMLFVKLVDPHIPL